MFAQIRSQFYVIMVNVPIKKLYVFKNNNILPIKQIACVSIIYVLCGFSSEHWLTICLC
jgi:hypothetical protein